MENRISEIIVKEINSKDDYIESDNCLVLADERLRELGYDIFPFDTFFIKAGEDAKSFSVLQKVLDKMIEKNLDRTSVLYVIGGGTITDLGGLCASLYMRGIKHVFIPTTLLGMVDASIGGKCAINYKTSKNNIGAMKNSEKIYLDKRFIKTLKENEFCDGVVEAIKGFSLLDDESFKKCEDIILNDNDHNKLVDIMIPNAAILKSDIVSEDYRERGKRVLLNLGHTLGHAIEKATDYKISHGRAVALGLIYESRHKLYKRDMTDRFKRIFEKLYGDRLYDNFSKIDKNKLLDSMIRDKKKCDKFINFPYLKELGKPDYEELELICLIEELIGFI